MPERIIIFDTTLRDGEQAPGFSLKVHEKLQLARQLDALGVDVIEAGFPISSEADAESVRAVAAEVRRPVVAALARCRREDIERAGQSRVGSLFCKSLRSFLAPQVGWRRRASSSASTSSGSVWCGQESGLRERSCKPERPAS